MSARGRHVVVEADGRRLSALVADVRSDRVVMRRWHTATRPDDVDPADEKALRDWASGQLKAWKVGKGRVVCSVPRAEVVLKRVHLSGAGAASDSDRAGMVALQMSRQLSLSMQEPVIEYVPLDSGDESSGLDVLAAAVPRARLDWLRGMAKSSGGRLRRVGLRSEGVATLVAGAAPDETGAVLGVGLGAATTDFVVVEGGELRFARSADVPIPHGQADEAEYARRVSVEAKRTWMSYRMTADSRDVERVLVVGANGLATEVAERCGESLELGGETVGWPSFVEAADEVAEDDRVLALPLAGLLAQDLVGARRMDLANPRRAPDTGAATRQRAMVGVLGAIVIAGGGYVLAQGELRSLETRRESLRGEVGALRDEYAAALRRHARVEHAEHFVATGVDWIAHLSWLSDVMPDPRDALADQFRATMIPGVTFEPRTIEGGAQYAGGRWSHSQTVDIVLDGRVRDRATADALRDTLIESGVYTVDTRGPDAEDRFSFELISRVAEPPTSEAGGGADAEDAGGTPDGNEERTQ